MNYFGVAGLSATRNSAALAATGVPFLVWNWVAIGVALMVVGGVLTIGTRLLPRVALDPVQDASGRYHLRLTRNGRPWARRAKAGS